VALIVKGTNVIFDGDGWDGLEDYPKSPRSAVKEVILYPIERSEMGQVYITYKDGAVGSFTGDTFRNLLAYLKSIEGWPVPVIFYKPLPACAAPAPSLLSEPNTRKRPQEKEPESVHVITARRTRTATVASKQEAPTVLVRTGRTRTSH
jgi:hypothetical protein